MYDPPPALHEHFERALARARSDLGGRYPLLIAGRERWAVEEFEDRSPINAGWLLGSFQKATTEDARDALAAARAAFPAWSGLTWRARVRLLRRAARILERRSFEIGAAAALEVGKNRLEALADVAETVALIRYYADQVERHRGFLLPLGRESVRGYRARNESALRPFGVWVVISPFNFPVALAGGPCAGALLAGNTVVMKPATDTPWTGYLLARCFLDAGLPEGVLNYVTGPGSTVGEELITSPLVDGITFTGSYEVGTHILRGFARGRYPRPCIAEMGGKNAVIVSRRADLDRAALGVMRSAFGLQGQKCSATSRVYVERPVKDALVRKLVDLTAAISIGDPTCRDNWMGPVINRSAYRDYAEFCGELRAAGTVLVGGRQLSDGALADGYFCAPTIVDGVPESHRLWRHEMFLPILMVDAVDSLADAMRRANDVDYGLTAGFYGSKKEAAWFFEHIQAGVAYANRAQGATTGAWPGYQPFGGWKASGSSGRGAGGPYYVQQYLREQTRTLVE